MGNFREVEYSDGVHKLYGYYQDNKSNNNLVLIPGSYTHHSIWEPVIETSNINANIMLVELPGFGKSTPRIPDGTIEEFASLILKLIDAAKIKRFFVGGHSIGGMIAIEMIDHASKRIDGVISCEGWTHASVEKNAFNNLKNELLTLEQMEKRKYFGTIARTSWTDDEIKAYSKIWRKWGKGKSILDKCEIPVLEIWGDRGLKHKPGREELQIPDKDNINLVWIENGGHSMLIQYPSLIGKEIASFINNSSKK
ncbi:MAG TPA: alpha/beta hydrolase [Clostridiales bacterium]|nr:alpha/beta hydrolase [Clostridiales bacterium]